LPKAGCKKREFLSIDFRNADGIGCGHQDTNFTPTAGGTEYCKNALLPRITAREMPPMSITASFLMKKKILCWAITAVILAGGVAFFYWQRAAPNAQKQADLQPAYKTQIDGLRFYELRQGQRVVSITADRFAIRKGKFGFFSTGLTRKATLQNALIEIYAAPPATGSSPGKISPQSGRTPDFTHLFAEETFSSLLPVRNIAEIEITPITVRLRDDDAVLASIFAVKATILLREKKIRFTGQVRVSSGDAELLTEQLIFIPETSRLQTDQPFLLKRGDVATRGARLKTDIFLKPGTATNQFRANRLLFPPALQPARAESRSLQKP